MISSRCSAHLLRSSIPLSLTFPTPCRPITPVHRALSVTSDSVSDKLGTENWCLLLYVCSLYHPSLHSTYKCFPYDASNVYTTETGDYKDFINICFAVHFLIYIIARCHGNLRQRCDQRTVMLLYKPNECFTSVDC